MQEFPGKRAPTIQLCRDPAGYVPLGNNPWRGPPVPIGTPSDVMEDDTPEDGRNILPPNKFPYIPPGADPDPGYPVAPGLLPPDAPRGPGRRRISRGRTSRRRTRDRRRRRTRRGFRRHRIQMRGRRLRSRRAGRPIRPIRRTSSPGRTVRRLRPRRRRRPRERHLRPGGTSRSKSRGMEPATARTISTQASSSTRPAVRGYTRRASLTCGHKRIGSI